MAKHRTFTPEFKAQIVMTVLTGDRTVAEVCRQHQLSDTLFYRWKADLLAALPHILASDPQLEAAQARIAELERLVGRLVIFRAILRQGLSAIVRHPFSPILRHWFSPSLHQPALA